jgi:hypothetical protein
MRKIFISKTGLSARLGMAIPTLNARLKALGIKEDGICINGRRAPSIIFDTERLSELRRLLANPPEVVT